MSPIFPATQVPFDFKDPKEISAVSLTLDSPLEPIVGYAKGISGTLAFDPAHPERSSGKVSVDAASIRFANEGYTATAQGYALNAKKWPQLTLELRGIERVKKTSASRFEGFVLADFTCRGITRSKRLAVTADYFPGKAGERTNGRYQGDLLVLRTHFSVSRKEHGISEGIPDSLVGDSIEVGVAVVGIHYSSGGKTAEAESNERPSVKPPIPIHVDPLARRLPKIGGGAPLSLRDVQGKAPLVALFLNEQCGVTVFYRDRIRDLERDFAGKGFRFVAIRTGRKEFPERPIELPERRYLRMPFLDDIDGVLMRSYGVGQSMSFALLDRRGKVRYFGGLDDSVAVDRVRRNPLRDAMRDLASGRPVRVTRAPVLGCAILPLER